MKALCVALVFALLGSLAEASSANERAVTSEAVAVRAAVLQQTAGMSSEFARETAVAQLRREELLLELAAREGVELSDSYVRDRIADMRSMAVTDGDNVFEEAAQFWGMQSVDQFASDPRVLSIYRRGLLIGEMRLRVTERLKMSPALDDRSRESIDRYLSAVLHDVSVRFIPGEFQNRDLASP